MYQRVPDRVLGGDFVDVGAPGANDHNKTPIYDYTTNRLRWVTYNEWLSLTGGVMDFTTGSLPSGVSFSRSSIATRYNASGLLETVSTNVARFDYDPVTLQSKGLLIEPSKMNVYQKSETFDTWTTIGTLTRTADYANGPGGTQIADRVQYTPGSIAYLYQSFSPATVNGNQYTWSVWAKSLTGSNQTINVFLPATGVVFGAITVTPTLQRLSVTGNVASANTYAGLIFQTSAFDVLLFGAQLETGSLSSYVPTTSAAVTRAADSCSFTLGTGVTSLRYVFDDDSTQDVSVSAGSYTIPTNLNRPHIKKIYLAGGT